MKKQSFSERYFNSIEEFDYSPNSPFYSYTYEPHNPTKECDVVKNIAGFTYKNLCSSLNKPSNLGDVLYSKEITIDKKSSVISIRKQDFKTIGFRFLKTIDNQKEGFQIWGFGYSLTCKNV
jgi:hypothetical protein